MLLPESPGSPVSASVASRAWRRDLFVLILAFCVLYGFRLGSYPLANPDEGRNAEIAREMIATGDFVTPRLNGVNYFEKPPVVYWAVAASLQVFGETEWAVRLVPALFGLAGVLFTYAAGYRLYGRAAGIAAAVVLGTSLLFFGLSRFLILDMAVSVLMSGTLFCFILGMRAPAGATRRWLFYGLYATAALATLTKGLIGFLVTGAVMFLWLLIFNQWKRLLPLYLPSGLLLFFAITVPWHVLAATHNETWVHRYFVYEHFERFTSTAASRPGPWYYFIPIILLGIFPWTGFLMCSLQHALAGGWTARKERADAWFFVVWVGFVFLFFSVSKSKLPPYILPVFPPLAVVIGAWLATASPVARNAPRLRRGLRVFSFICGLLSAALLVVVFKAGLVIKDHGQAETLRPFAVMLAVVLFAGGVLAPWLGRTRGERPALVTMAATIALFFGVLTFAAPAIQRPGTKALAEIVSAAAQPGERVMHYHEFFHDFTFYARRVVDVVAFKGELELEEDAAARASGRFIEEPEFRSLWTRSARIFAVARKRDVKELFGDPAFRYRLLGETRDHYLFDNQP
jgi:4-amino-4-deoxy-L-arabinose transferase-like glycosyltransferase